MSISKLNLSGFTLVELLMVVAIILIMIVGTVSFYNRIYGGGLVTGEGAKLLDALRRTQAESEAGFHDAAHGVFFDRPGPGGNRYIRYQGDSYLTRDASYDEIYFLAPAFTLVPNLTPAGNDLNFSRGLGQPSATGTVNLIMAGQNPFLIMVNPGGTLYESIAP